jgi:hypothetical protein
MAIAYLCALVFELGVWFMLPTMEIAIIIIMIIVPLNFIVHAFRLGRTRLSQGFDPGLQVMLDV